MKFIDEAIIKVHAGHGGAGMAHFRREKFVPMGGPDGGNGGRGGSIILRANSQKRTLVDFQFKSHWKASSGRAGGTSCKNGRGGEDLYIDVPPGTEVINEETGELVTDLAEAGTEFVLCKGGRGGLGNTEFKSPTNQAPDYAQPGEEGGSGIFKLSLKLVADVGLLGFPNAGKSTLISRISSARPRIADYPFTTLQPELGVVRAKGGRSFVVADIPGIIEGAHEGKGLGIQFLKHIERTRVLAHLIDPQQIDAQGEPVDPLETFRIINRELSEYSEELAKKRQVVVLTKMDTCPDPEFLARTSAAFAAEGHICLMISSVSGQGLDELIEALAGSLEPATVATSQPLDQAS